MKIQYEGRLIEVSTEKLERISTLWLERHPNHSAQKPAPIEVLLKMIEESQE